jgi:hypothetical protein
MIRAACWLASEVGEGGIFTKEELRDALPGVAQIDRRVRDLRKHGWVIEEARQGAGLVANQQRLATIGTAVWDKEARMAAPISVISAKVREEVFFRDGHACRRCGIAAGEVFDDDASVTARLTAGHLYPDSLGGKATAADLITTCQRCNESLQQVTQNYADSDQVLKHISSLGVSQQERLALRIIRDSREVDDVDTVWREYRQLPGVDRERVKGMVASGQLNTNHEDLVLVSVSPRVRQDVLFRDGHTCVRCGISAGEFFDDDQSQKARLNAVPAGGRHQQSSEYLPADLVTECQRCSSADRQGGGSQLDARQLVVRVQGLGRELRIQLLKRIQSNTRPADKVDKIWKEYRQLSNSDQTLVLTELKKLLGA